MNHPSGGGGGQEGGRPGEKGAGGVREAEKRGREAGFPRWREAGEKGKNYATLRNISQSKKCKGREPKNTGREPGLKGTGSGRFKPPCPPHTLQLQRCIRGFLRIPLFFLVGSRSYFKPSKIPLKYETRLSWCAFSFEVHT